MIPLDKLQEIAQETPSRIVLLVIDGLGGLPHPDTGKTELETARTPNLDALAGRGMTGLLDPVAPGITPGSAPGHLGLFGYDPLVYEVGRGVVEALGIDFDLQPADIAARGNFCTVDERGIITDRRAGRLATKENARLCRLLSTVKIEGAQVFVKPVKEHRFVLVLRGEGLETEVGDTDPQKAGMAPLPPKALTSKARRTARLADRFLAHARERLAGAHPANMVLLRGFSRLPSLPQMRQVFKLNPAAIAQYPMYRGLAKVVGMTVLPAPASQEEALSLVEKHYEEFTFFFVHVKGADRAGEDGDFAGKVRVLEEIDSLLPRLLRLQPEVLAITGDHSTPATYKGHSWHPVPLLLVSRWCRPEGREIFSERCCQTGGLGRLRAAELMSLLLAHAGKLTKYGA